MKCKSIIILSAIFFHAVGEMKADDTTTTTILGAKSVVITESSRGLKAIVDIGSDSVVFEQMYGSEATVTSHVDRSGFNLTGRQKTNKSVRWNTVSNGLGFGFCSAPGAPGMAGIEMGKSFEISWLNILAMQATNRFGNSFSLGVGINWRNYRTTLDHCFWVNEGQVEIRNYPEGVTPRFSRIKIFSVQFPLLYSQSLPFGLSKEHFALRLGPIFNLNSHASVLTAWKGGKYDVNGINVRPFTIDLFAALHIWDFCSLYVRYSPYKALTGHHQLNFHQFSTGVLFML